MAACCHIVGIVFLCKCNDSKKHRFELTFATFSLYHIKANFTPQVSLQNKWISPQMEPALDLLEKYLGKCNIYPFNYGTVETTSWKYT